MTLSSPARQAAADAFACRAAARALRRSTKPPTAVGRFVRDVICRFLDRAAARFDHVAGDVTVVPGKGFDDPRAGLPLTRET